MLIRVVVAGKLWDALNEQNHGLSQILLALSHLHAADPSAYAIVVKYLSTLQYLQVRRELFPLVFP